MRAQAAAPRPQLQVTDHIRKDELLERGRQGHILGANQGVLEHQRACVSRENKAALVGFGCSIRTSEPSNSTY